jgi:hypothetical protein
MEYSLIEFLCLYHSNLSEASPEVLGLNIEIMRFLSLFLKHCAYPLPLADSEWDFIMCSMLAWLEVNQPDVSSPELGLCTLCISWPFTLALNRH